MPDVPKQARLVARLSLIFGVVALGLRGLSWRLGARATYAVPGQVLLLLFATLALAFAIAAYAGKVTREAWPFGLVALFVAISAFIAYFVLH